MKRWIALRVAEAVLCMSFIASVIFIYLSYGRHLSDRAAGEYGGLAGTLPLIGIVVGAAIRGIVGDGRKKDG
jgi:hypothetical protein